MRRFLLLLLGLLLSFETTARILTYVEANPSNDPDQIALGYPVPIPVDQSQALAGFRSLAGIYARHRELSLQANGPRLEVWGRSIADRPIEALCFGPTSPTQVVYVGGVHAREWAAPEAVLGLAEWLSNAGQQPLIDWVAQTIPLCVVTVLNPDGLAHTQQLASQTRICEAPEQPGLAPDCPASTSIPRDGRMRRKNLRDADNDLNTTTNSFLGVDLNRNVGPFWATSNNLGLSSDMPDRLIYHGPERSSEPEASVLEEWVAQAQPDQLRLYMDVHSFGRLYFWNCFAIARLDATANDWIERFRLAARQPYRSVPTGDPRNGQGCGRVGIGATDELFGFQLRVPAYTLELEPEQSSAEYGGRGVTRDGFMLPEAIVPAMREDARQMLLLAASLSQGRPWLREVTVRDTDSALLYQGQWQPVASQRQLQTVRPAPVQAGQSLIIDLQFDRPMRWLGEDGVIRAYPGLEQALPAQLRLSSSQQSWTIDTTNGAWLAENTAAGLSRYRVEASVPSDWQSDSGLRLEVQSLDNARQPLDANPASPAVWSAGAFDQQEDGFDLSHCLVALSSQNCIQEMPANSGGGGSGGGSIWLALLLLLRARRSHP